MPTVGPIATPQWQDDSLLIEKSISFQKLPIRIFRPAHNTLNGCNILQFRPFTSLHPRHNSYQNGNSSIVVASCWS